MLVRDIMTRPVVSIGPDEPISDVIALMAQRRLRHFPVVDAGRLVGIVSDRDLRTVGADHPSARPGVTPRDPVRALMSAPVWTASPLDPIDEAAALLRRRAIGALVTMTGVEAGTTRIEVELPRDTGSLAALLNQVAERGAEVVSVLGRREDDAVRFVLRLATIDVRAIAAALDAAGFDVVWPPVRAPGSPESP